MDLELVLRRAVELGASDIHLKVERPPMLRRDGNLAELEGESDLSERDLELALEQVCAETPKRLQTFLETGELDSAYSPPGLPRFRVNGFRQRGSISIAFRVIPREVPNFGELSLPPGVRRLAEEHRGLVLVTGATGSGKTTTLAAIVDHINRAGGSTSSRSRTRSRSSTATMAASSTSVRSASTPRRSPRRSAEVSARTRT